MRVYKTPKGCLEWTGPRDTKRGYGIFIVDGKRMLAHRASWVWTNGRIPAYLSVLHKCDNPPCINPKHLFLGMQLDNIRDMILKGRNNPVSGEDCYKAKLTFANVKWIRNNYIPYKMSMRKIAKRFDVCHKTIQSVLNKKSWK